MARALHLLKRGDHGVALATIERQVGAGDSVIVAVLPGASAPAVPAWVAVHRVPDDWSYERLLEAMFEADQVAAW
jgi:hypothetical protein